MLTAALIAPIFTSINKSNNDLNSGSGKMVDVSAINSVVNVSKEVKNLLKAKNIQKSIKSKKDIKVKVN